FGLSNFDAGELDEAQAIAGPRGVTADQVFYHLGERAIEHDVLPFCERNHVALMAYSPFGSSDFPRASSAGGRVLAAIARAHDALAFLTRRACVFAIPKAASAAHAVENARAAELTLDPEDIARIDATFPRGEPRALPSL